MVREAEFKRLVRLVARLFYSEGVPPPDEPGPEDDPKPKRKITTVHATLTAADPD